MATNKLSRRAVLGAPLLATLDLTTDSRAAAAGLNERTRARISEIDAAFQRWEIAVAAECDHPIGSPDEFAASELMSAINTEIEALNQKVWKEPVQGWDDVAVLARLAEHWQRRCSGLIAVDREEAERRVHDAIRVLIGTPSLPASYFAIESIDQLINALDGVEGVAMTFGLTSGQVETWKSQEFIPPSWHHRIANEVGRRGFRLNPDFFQRWG